MVTGATGFVGQRVVKRLVDTGVPHEVVRGRLEDPGVFRGVAARASGWLHLARKTRDPDHTGFDVNVAMARNLADVAAGTPMVTLSSVGVYGHGAHRYADESTPEAPDTALGRSQAAADALLRDAGASILRPRFVVGPGDRHVVPGLSRLLARSPVWVDAGRAELSFVHVDDLAYALIAALPWESGVWHVTDGHPIRFRDVAAVLGARPRVSVPFRALYAPVRLRERLLGLDPEGVSGLSSIRLKLLARDQSFSSARLHDRLGVPFRTFRQAVTPDVSGCAPETPGAA